MAQKPRNSGGSVQTAARRVRKEKKKKKRRMSETENAHTHTNAYFQRRSSFIVLYIRRVYNCPSAGGQTAGFYVRMFAHVCYHEIRRCLYNCLRSRLLGSRMRDRGRRRRRRLPNELEEKTLRARGPPGELYYFGYTPAHHVYGHTWRPIFSLPWNNCRWASTRKRRGDYKDTAVIATTRVS